MIISTKTNILRHGTIIIRFKVINIMSTVTEYEESGITKGKIARLAVSSMELEILNQEYNHNHNLSY